MEYALVLFAFIATLACLCALWHQAQAGGLQRRAQRHVAGNLEQGVTVELLQDLAAC